MSGKDIFLETRVDKEHLSLNNLRDIVVPEAPSLWPPGPGGIILFGIVILFLLTFCYRWYCRWRRDGYRREGILLLQDAATIHEVSVLLKRVALVVFDRERVASLCGCEWARFLNRVCPHCHFQDDAFADTGADAARDLVVQAAIWIKRHKVQKSGAIEPGV